MHDLTSGSVSRHLLKTTGFMLVTMIFQTLYFLIDLYWVGRLGTTSVAGVAIAGNLTFIVLALTQMLGVGTTTLISHAAGRKDHADALIVFNQSQVLAMVVGVAFLAVGLVSAHPYTRAMSADAETARLANSYLAWYVPAMALQFAMVAMGSALRGVGNFKPGMVVSTATVVLNMLLAPVLIFGWGTGRPLGVAGAAMSTFVSVVVGLVWFLYYFKPGAYLHFVVADWKPKFGMWKRMLAVGLPAGFEFALMAVYLVIVYSVTRPFGAAAQAGFGIGQRVIQAGFMPIVALGFAVAPVAGQNVGARLPERVRATYKDAVVMATVGMAVFALLCHIAPAALIGVFSKDPAAISVGDEYLRIVSWNYVASGILFVNSSMFQALGNTIPSVIASVIRIILVGVPAVIISRMPGFQLTWLWYVAVGAVLVQLVLSLLLLQREFRKRLASGAPAVGSTGAEAIA
ncbi:MAG TPA: MATE family efflux transporter [Gemmatimonadaceae bacterium]|nr:MATE family efflux transporter [Gemmatimonadaceae bacterium]